MAQLFRAYKFKVPILIHVCNNYNGQRCASTHYEVLRISPSATQKEIRDAYIKLSKEMHPDTGKNGNHADFVKINEAYRALNKRKINNGNIKYRYSDASTTNFHKYYRYNNASKQWEEYTMRYAQNKKYSMKNQTEKLVYCLWILILASILKALYFATFVFIDRRSRIQMSKQIQLEYLELLKECQNESIEKKIQRIKDLTEKYASKMDD